MSSVDVYFVCATSEKDSLNQWMHYSRSQGYAVGLGTRRVEHNLGLVNNGPAKLPMNTARWVSGWCQVVYDRATQERLARELLAFAARHYAREEPGWDLRLKSTMAALAARFKHSAFAARRRSATSQVTTTCRKR